MADRHPAIRELLETIEAACHTVDLLETRGASSSVTAYLRVLLQRERAQLLAPASPVFRRVEGSRFAVGAGDSVHEVELGRGAVLAWLVLAGQAREANEILGRARQNGDATRKQIKRLADRLEAYSVALGAQVRAIAVSRSGALSLPRPSTVHTR